MHTGAPSSEAGPTAIDLVRDGGVVDSAGGVTPCGHVCWAYRNRPEFLARAAQYLIDGIESGQRVEFVTDDVDRLHAELTVLPTGRQLLDDDRGGVATVATFDWLLGSSEVGDAEAAVAARVAAIEHALADRYTGFRAVIDATAIVRTAAQRAAFARFEYLIDRQMRVLPIAAMCAYDVRDLGSAAVCELACLHPFVNDDAVEFRLYAEDGAEFALAGEIDLACRELFDTTLGRVVPLADGPKIIVDGRPLEFIDPRGLCVLERHARELDRQLVLRSGSPTIARVVELLGLRALRVQLEPPAGVDVQ